MNFVDLLCRCERRFAKEYTAANPPGGLTRHRLRVLAVVENVPSASASQIIEATGIDRSTVSSMLANMERELLVKRVRDEGDARLVHVTLTPEGRAALHRARRVAKSAESAVLGNFSAAKRKVLFDSLRDIANA